MTDANPEPGAQGAPRPPAPLMSGTGTDSPTPSRVGEVSRALSGGVVQSSPGRTVAGSAYGVGVEGVRPKLVVISGSPASGKTVLACELAGRLQLPVIAHDTVRLGLAETMAIADPDAARTIGPEAWRVFYDLVALMVAGNVSVIAEAHFHHGRSEMELAMAVAGAHAVLVHCVVDRSTALQRVRLRLTDPARPRRLAFGDEGTRERMESNRFEWDLYEEPPALGVPTMTVDTTNGYAPSIEEIEAFIRAARRG